MLTTQKHHYRPKNLKPPLVKPPLIEAAASPSVKPERVKPAKMKTEKVNPTTVKPAKVKPTKVVKPAIVKPAKAKPEKRRRIRIECSIDAEGNYHFSPGGQTISACTVEWLRKKNGIPKSDTAKIKKLVILRYIYVYLRHPAYLTPTRAAGSESNKCNNP